MNNSIIAEDKSIDHSISEEHGLRLITPNDLIVFSPGISTAGNAEIRMALAHKQRIIITTTIDKNGLISAQKNIHKLGLEKRIEAKLEDLTKEFSYPAHYFDFIYARLVLHYLSSQELDITLAHFRKSLKPKGKLFIVVRSEKNIDFTDPKVEYDSVTKFTKELFTNEEGIVNGWGMRYFHTRESIRSHLEKAGFAIISLKEYEEQLYKDFARTEKASKKDHLIEVIAQ